MGLTAFWYVKCIYVMLLLYLNLQHVCEMAEKALLAWVSEKSRLFYSQTSEQWLPSGKSV